MPKHNTSSLSAEETSVAKTTVAKKPDSSLLLDFDDSGVGDSSGAEQTDINETEKNTERSLDQILLDGLSPSVFTQNSTSSGNFDAENHEDTFKAGGIDTEQPEEVTRTKLNAEELEKQMIIEPLLPDINAPLLLNETKESDLMLNESYLDTLGVCAICKVLMWYEN